MANNLDQTDHIVAATFAASKCAAMNKTDISDYIEMYDEFIEALLQRKALLEEHREDQSMEDWKKLAE